MDKCERVEVGTSFKRMKKEESLRRWKSKTEEMNAVVRVSELRAKWGWKQVQEVSRGELTSKYGRAKYRRNQQVTNFTIRLKNGQQIPAEVPEDGGRGRKQGQLRREEMVPNCSLDHGREHPWRGLCGAHTAQKLRNPGA